MSLRQVAASINASMAARSSMKVGEVIDHPNGYKVHVVSGAFLVEGRVSNFWYWRRVNDDGTLGRLESGYGW